MPTTALTRKGERTSAAILAAAVRCVARDGVAGSSLQRVADEAGVGKRAVVYYYATREGLLDAVVRHVGDAMLDRVAEAVLDVRDPTLIVDRSFDVLWKAIMTDRGLLAAWFGLHAESVTNADFRESASYIGDRIEQIAATLIDAQRAMGRRFRVPPDALRVLIVVNIEGFAAYYLQHGEAPALQAALAEFRTFLSTVVTFDPADRMGGPHEAASRTTAQ